MRGKQDSRASQRLHRSAYLQEEDPEQHGRTQAGKDAEVKGIDPSGRGYVDDQLLEGDEQQSAQRQVAGDPGLGPAELAACVREEDHAGAHQEEEPGRTRVGG